MTRFRETCIRLRLKHPGKTFVEPKGRHLIDAFNRGDKFRVKVRTTYPSGETRERWGYVSITGGWAPSFMLMARRGQHGSSDLLRETDEIIETRYLP